MDTSLHAVLGWHIEHEGSDCRQIHAYTCGRASQTFQAWRKGNTLRRTYDWNLFLFFVRVYFVSAMVRIELLQTCVGVRPSFFRSPTIGTVVPVSQPLRARMPEKMADFSVLWKKIRQTDAHKIGQSLNLDNQNRDKPPTGCQNKNHNHHLQLHNRPWDWKFQHPLQFVRPLGAKVRMVIKKVSATIVA